MKYAECAEANEKSIFLFLVFEIWPFLYSKLVNIWWILSTKSTIFQKLKIIKLFSHILKVFKLTWKMRNVLNLKKNQISDFSDFYLSSYEEKHNVAGNSGLPLSANLLKLESSILSPAKQATNLFNVATEKRSKKKCEFFFLEHFSKFHFFFFLIYMEDRKSAE